MIKNENLSKNAEKIHLSQKSLRDSKSENKIHINIENKYDINEINEENPKIIKYRKYAKLIEDYFINKYGQEKIKEKCFICKMNEFSSKELLFFEKEKNLFYYLKYLFCLNKNKLIISNETFFGNKHELNKYNKMNFLSKVKFSFSKVVCKICFCKIINEKDIIQNIIKVFNDNNDINSPSSIEIINNQNFEENNPSKIIFNELNDNINENYNNNFAFINNNLDAKNDKNICNLNNNNHNNINNNNYITYNNFNKYNIVINDIIYKNNITINSNNLEKENNSNNNLFNNSNFFYENNNIEKKVNSNNENFISKKNNQNELLNKNNLININNINIKEKNQLSESNIIKNLFSDQFPDLLLCLTELKEKISEIIKIFKQLKKQYDFILNYYPNLIEIILCFKKSFFLLNFVATSEIVNNLAISHHYIFQRINIISKIIIYLENKPNISSEIINEISNLKITIQNIRNKAEKNNKDFRDSMNKFMDFLKNFPYLNNNNKNIG